MRALVFRSAYSAGRNARASAAFAASIKAHCAVFSETLMLQVRSAHPPSPHRTSSSSCSGVPVGLFGKPKHSTSRFAPLTLRNSSVGVRRAAALLTRMGARGRAKPFPRLHSPGGRSNQLHLPKPGKPTPGGVGGGRSRPRLKRGQGESETLPNLHSVCGRSNQLHPPRPGKPTRKVSGNPQVS